MTPPPPPSPPLPLDCTAAVAVLTQLSLLQHMTSFQQGFAVLFAPALRIYYAAGHRLRAPRSMEAYANMAGGENVRLAHAIGFVGDTSAADSLLRMWRGAKRHIFVSMGSTAISAGHAAIISWLLTHLEYDSVMNPHVDPYVQSACALNQVRVLDVLLEHVGRDRVQRAMDADRPLS